MSELSQEVLFPAIVTEQGEIIPLDDVERVVESMAEPWTPSSSDVSEKGEQ